MQTQIRRADAEARRTIDAVAARAGRVPEIGLCFIPIGDLCRKRCSFPRRGNVRLCAQYTHSEREGDRDRDRDTGIRRRRGAASTPLENTIPVGVAEHHNWWYRDTAVSSRLAELSRRRLGYEWSRSLLQLATGFHVCGAEIIPL